MTPERRTQRSEVPAEAARLYLDATARRHAHQALSLIDDQGLVVVEARSALNTEALAAIAPFAAHDAGVNGQQGLLDFVTKGEALRVWPVTLDGEPLYLAAVGGTPDMPTGAGEAMQRILGHA